MRTCKNCGTICEDFYKYCPNCGNGFENNTTRNDISDNPIHTETKVYSETHPMKWHSFLMVVMIIGAILTVISGITTITGTQYAQQGLDVYYIYHIYPNLKTCDAFYGLGTILLGVFQLITRNRLNRFRKNGPTMLKSWYILSILIQCLYLLSFSSITGIDTFNQSTITNLLGSLIMLLINGVYYSHRKDMFIN